MLGIGWVNSRRCGSDHHPAPRVVVVFCADLIRRGWIYSFGQRRPENRSPEPFRARNSAPNHSGHYICRLQQHCASSCPTLSTMSWLVSLFAGNKQSSRRGQAMHTTHEAFSLPTSSPIHSSHADAFDPDTLQTPDPESATSRSSYTYPPVSPIGPYGYGPTLYVPFFSDGFKP